MFIFEDLFLKKGVQGGPKVGIH